MPATSSNHSICNAAALWTGGKDSALALHEAGLNGCRARCLVTFAPPEPEFLAHPISLMKKQAEALGLPHFVQVVKEPFHESYEAGLRWLKETMDIDTVITGDIAEVGGNPNWIRERSRPVGMDVTTPLWGRDRLALLQRLLASGFKGVFSCVKTRWLSAEWVGRELDHAAIASLRELHGQNGLDLCGEQGEYHTLVTDGPEFKHRLHLGAFRVCQRAELAYMEVGQIELRD